MSSEMRQLQEAHSRAVADGMVKVRIPMDDQSGFEWCFGKRLSETHARLCNVPVFRRGVNYGDVVEFREQDEPHELFKTFVRVKTQGSFSLFVPVGDAAGVRQVVAKLQSAAESERPLAIEIAGVGWLVTAWPLSMKRSRATALVVRALDSSLED